MQVPIKLIAGLAVLAAGAALPGGASAQQQGYFTAEQAEQGAMQFGANCASCHGADLEGGVGPALRGIDFLGNWGTAAGIFDYFSVAMPPQAPGQLGEDVYIEILAHIMSVNGIPAGDTPLPTGDHAALEAINLTQAAAAGGGSASAATDTSTDMAAAEPPVPQAFTFGKPLPTLMPDGTIQDVVAGTAPGDNP